MSEVTQAAERLRRLEWNDHIGNILGRPCFACGALAEILRCGGADIPHKAEYEQAHVLLWTLNAYLEHGDKWREVCEAEIKRITIHDMQPTTPSTGGE